MDEKEEEAKRKEAEEGAAKEKAAADKDANTRIQSPAESLIEQSNKAAERNEKVLAEMKKENDRREQMDIAAKLAGKGQAGQTLVKPVDKEKEAADKRIKAVGDATGAVWAKNMEKKDE